MTPAELQAAFEASRPAMQEYVEAVKQYRNMEITAAQFVAACKARDVALAAYEAAEKEFLADLARPHGCEPPHYDDAMSRSLWLDFGDSEKL